MTIKEIAGNEAREKIFPAILEEACRQWCEFIEDAPERKSGEGFADFFYEIFQEKEVEFYQDYCMKNDSREKEASGRQERSL